MYGAVAMIDACVFVGVDKLAMACYECHLTASYTVGLYVSIVSCHPKKNEINVVFKRIHNILSKQ